MGNRVDFYTEDYNDLIKQKGMKAEWEQAIVCECMSNDSNQPNFTCPICHGSGFRYLPAKQIRVLSTTFSSSVKLETIGVREPGTAYITPPSTVIMGYRDRLKFVDFKCKYSETIQINPSTRFSDTTHRNIKEVLYLIKNNSQYDIDEDFVITEDGHHVQWINDATLPSGNLSILYLTTPSYLVVDLLHELRATYVEHKQPSETFKEFPKQYQVRREDFVYGVDTPIVKELGESSESSDSPEVISEDTLEDNYDDY